MVSQLRTRLLISNLVTVLLIVGLIGFILLERSSLEAQIGKLTAQEQAAGRARELSLYVQYNAHDTNAYTLGQLEHSAEYAEHALEFNAALADVQGWIDSEVLGKDEQEIVDQIKELHTRYDQAA